MFEDICTTVEVVDHEIRFLGVNWLGGEAATYPVSMKSFSMDLLEALVLKMGEARRGKDWLSSLVSQ